MTPLLATVRRALVAWGAPSAGETVVVALSGGPDSVALADVLTSLAPSLGFDVVIAHLDHQLRADSAEDAAFCRHLAGRLGWPIHVACADVRGRADRDGAGLEDAARRERYEFLQAVRRQHGAGYIAVGHTRDDQAETFLLRLLRGSGADGLASMRARSGEVLRPMLRASRRDVIEHLTARGLSWREDPTNTDLSLMRNRVRHELLPYLASRFNPEVGQALARAAELLAEDAAALDAPAAARVQASIRRDGSAWVLPLSIFDEATVAESRRLLRRLIASAGGLTGVGAHHVESVRALLGKAAASGHRLSLPGRRVALVSFGELRIEPVGVAEPPVYAFPLPVPSRVVLPGGLAVSVSLADGPPRLDGESAVIAAPPTGLEVRTRRPGDRVVDGGREMSLKRFLMKSRVPATERPSLPLVAAGAHVLWMPGAAPSPAPFLTGGECVRIRLERTA